jgi:hypothetical protein
MIRDQERLARFQYILDERFSEPAISELVVTSDGFVLAQAEGEVGANEILGTEVDLNRDLLDLIAAAGLTAEEIHESGKLQRKHIRRYRSRTSRGDGFVHRGFGARHPAMLMAHAAHQAERESFFAAQRNCRS